MKSEPFDRRGQGVHRVPVLDVEVEPDVREGRGKFFKAGDVLRAAMEFSRPSWEKPRCAMATGRAVPSPEAKNGCRVLTPEAYRSAERASVRG